VSSIKNVEHRLVAKDPNHAHCFNQVTARQLSNGEVFAVFNEERYPFHHDSGRTVFIRSRDDGETWTEPEIVLDWTAQTGNWDCGICELSDGTLLVNMTMCGFFKRGIKPEKPSWISEPVTEEWGDWTWDHFLRGWLGTYVVKSKDQGLTWSQPIPVNVRPLKHAGCRLGCWQMPDGPILMGVYGRIRGYGEEGEYESTRSALIRSDDGGDNWEYFSTLAYDPAAIRDFEEPALLRLKDGRMVCMMRTHSNPSNDAKNMAIVVSEDNGFSWSAPKWTNIWGFPAELSYLPDGRVLMVYGYRRPPYGERGCTSEDGVTWDVKDEFVIREGGVPGASQSQLANPFTGNKAAIDYNNPGVYQHIGYPSLVVLDSGKILCLYHEWSDDPQPIHQIMSTTFEMAD